MQIYDYTRPWCYWRVNLQFVRSYVTKFLDLFSNVLQYWQLQWNIWSWLKVKSQLCASKTVKIQCWFIQRWTRAVVSTSSCTARPQCITTDVVKFGKPKLHWFRHATNIYDLNMEIDHHRFPSRSLLGSVRSHDYFSVGSDIQLLYICTYEYRMCEWLLSAG